MSGFMARAGRSTQIIQSFPKRIIWMEPDRFDSKPNKSPWLEMSRSLHQEGFDIVLLTGYRNSPYTAMMPGLEIISLSSINLSFIFRYSLMVNMLIWALLHANRQDLFILNQATLLLAPMLRLLGYSRLHLDIRTLPLRANKSVKKRIDRFLFWTVPLSLFRGCVKGYSFITERLRLSVAEEFHADFADSVIWQSGVNSSVFKPIGNGKNRDARDENYTVLYHGSIYGNRGVDEIVKAMALLRSPYKEHIRLVIVGPILGNVDLTRVIESNRLHDKVVLEGLVPYEMIPGKIAMADCCVCPLPDLLEWNVSSPLKVFEYMACAKPIILTPIPAHKDVADKAKFVVWSKGASAGNLRDAIEYAYQHRDALSLAAQEAPEFVRKEYDWQVQGQKLAAYLIRKIT